MKQQVYDFLMTIPKGKVVTYGQIAAAQGRPGAARAVGNILHSNPRPDIYPCYKVVSAAGKLAKNFGWGGIDQQRLLLEADGVEVVGDTVDLKRFGMK